MFKIITIILGIVVFPVSSILAEDYHVLTLSSNGRSAEVVFHIPISAEDNSANISLQTVVAENAGGVEFVSRYIGISGAELLALQNGELYETVKSVKFLAADSILQKRTKIDNKFTSLTTEIVDELRQRFQFYGLSRNVP